MMKSEIDKLYAAVIKSRPDDPKTGATARLLAADRSKVAKKVVEEAAEVSLAAMADDRKEVVRETADLFYNLVVLLATMGIKPKDVWREMASRKAALGLAGKLPKAAKNGNGAGGGK